VCEFATFLGRSPDRVEPKDLTLYQLHLASIGARYARMNLAGTALRSFFHVMLGRPGFCDRVAKIPSPERLPIVLSIGEVTLLSNRARAHSTALSSTERGSGLHPICAATS
jgi:hypothetical protein